MNSQRARVSELLNQALAKPGSVGALSAPELDLLIRVARRVRLLGRLAADLQAANVLEDLPLFAQDQLLSALVYARARVRITLWELDRIAWALSASPPAAMVTMKGCAYLLLDIKTADTRFIADVDLLLAENELENVEQQLNEKGWRTRALSPYDDNYYRRWTHELPPLVHYERQVEIDLHHNLLPRTARLKPPAAPWLASAVSIPGSPFKVLSPPDMVLHAMVHLFFSDEMADKLRDLVDIVDLLAFFADADADFWQAFVSRAEELGLQRPAFYGIRYAKSLLGCEMPGFVEQALESWGPPMPIWWLMDKLVPRALYPSHPDYPSKSIAICRWLLFVRSHWIRMPPWLLAYHLTYKFVRTRFSRK